MSTTMAYPYRMIKPGMCFEHTPKKYKGRREEPQRLLRILSTDVDRDRMRMTVTFDRNPSGPYSRNRPVTIVQNTWDCFYRDSVRLISEEEMTSRWLELVADKKKKAAPPPSPPAPTIDADALLHLVAELASLTRELRAMIDEAEARWSHVAGRCRPCRGYLDGVEVPRVLAGEQEADESVVREGEARTPTK